jgi:hypothetical protein
MTRLTAQSLLTGRLDGMPQDDSMIEYEGAQVLENLAEGGGRSTECVLKNEPAIDKGADQTRPDTSPRSQPPAKSPRKGGSSGSPETRTTWIMLRWQSFGAKRVRQG